jgi:insulysin
LHAAGPCQYIFDELKHLGDLRFAYLDKVSSIDYCVELANCMPLFKDDLTELIRFHHCYDEFNLKQIRYIADLLVEPKNTVMFLTSPELDESVFDRFEPWYRIPYNCVPYTKEQLNFMRNPSFPAEKLGLPPPNPFMPRSIELMVDPVFEPTLIAK